GVTVFFVISGFLITGLLMREQGRSGQISLKRFYLRRAFRILPAFYTYILLVMACGALGLVEIKKYDAVWAALFTADYREQPWVLGHSWSLAVEEQFYLLWPPAL